MFSAEFEIIPLLGRLWDSLQEDDNKCSLPSVGKFFCGNIPVLKPDLYHRGVCPNFLVMQINLLKWKWVELS